MEREKDFGIFVCAYVLVFDFVFIDLVSRETTHIKNGLIEMELEFVWTKTTRMTKSKTQIKKDMDDCWLFPCFIESSMA